ncbi:MAG: hypothetical protein CMQ12_07515 [Gammaproteobacteria bacterium]|nr:hypothetical protein [Gammaproteobacteria bacterium]
MFRKLIIIGLFLPLGACGYLTGETGIFRNRIESYTDAPMLPAMTIPARLDSYTIDQLYVIPERLFATSEVFDRIPLPKPIETNRRQGVIIQSLGGNDWIVLDATPGQVWPLVRDYWTRLEIILDFEDPSAGIMETSWLEVDNEIESRHKYRVTIEPGLHSGYSEIYVLHMQSSRSESAPTVLNWPESSDSADKERQILETVSQYLADRNDVYQASTSSLLAGSIEAEHKANIIENELGEQILELRIEFNRAWVQVRQALENAEIVIVDSDRTEAYFNVKFAGIVEEEDVGFIGRLFGGNDDEVVQEKDFSIRLQETGTVVNVLMQAQESSEETDQILEELLQVINDNLS